MTVALDLKKIDRRLDFISRLIAVDLLALILPLLLLPIIKFLGFSEIIEDLAKALVVVFVILKFSKKSFQFWGAVSFGFLFALSESVFYLSNFWQLGDLSIFWQRLLWTVPMHIFTVLIILYFSLLNKKLAIVGWVASLLVHLFFNLAIVN